MPFILGVVFWAHGKQSNDAWFDGEQLTGEIITGVCIASVGLYCCAMACICAGMSILLAKNSQENDNSNDVVKATRFLEGNAQPKSLLLDEMKAVPAVEMVDDLESATGFEMK